MARLAYERWVGPIPKGHYAILQCGTFGCMAPMHVTIKSAQWHLEDMRAESLAARYIRDDAKERRYRLSPTQIHEVDAMLREIALALMAGEITKAEHEHRMLEIEQYVGFITHGCCAPSIEQAVGAEIPQDRRWFANGMQGPEQLRGPSPRGPTRRSPQRP